MFEENNPSLLALIKLMSENFTAEERQFAGNLAFKLSERIAARREIAGVGGKELDINISFKFKLGSAVTKKAIPEALKWILLPSVTGVAIAGGASTGIAIGVGLVVFGGACLLEARAKNKIKAKADIYKDYFPRDNHVIKLLSQLVTLSMSKELQVTALQAEEKYTPWQHIKNGLSNVASVITAEKVASTKEQEKIKTLVESEFKEIWNIFKRFTHNQEDYDAFKEESLAKKITYLFESHLGLGDPNDRSEIINDRDIHRLWINLFACYLEGRDETVRALVMGELASKLNVFEVNQGSLEQPPMSTKKVQAMFPLFQRGANDESLSFIDRRTFSPQFFYKKSIPDSYVEELKEHFRPLMQVD